MDSLAEQSVDVIICDPPYSEHTHALQRQGHNAQATYNRSRELGFDSLTDDVRHQSAEAIARITKRWALLFCDDRHIGAWIDDLESCGMEFIRLGIWIKRGATPQFSGDRPAQGHDAIVIAHRPGKKHWNGGGDHAVWAVPVESDNRIHPTQKPIVLLEALVRLFSDPGDLVCDPFSGSFTTAVACKRLGRNFIGWEMERKYVRAGQLRVDGTMEQLDMAMAEKKPRSKQLTWTDGKP